MSPPLTSPRGGRDFTVGERGVSSVPRSVPGSTFAEPGIPRAALTRQPPSTYSADAVTWTANSAAIRINSRILDGVHVGWVRSGRGEGEIEDDTMATISADPAGLRGAAVEDRGEGRHARLSHGGRG